MIDKELEKDQDPVRVWTKAFRGTAFSEARMCPCAVLGAGSQDLPEQVAKEVKGFFKMCQEKLVAEGLSPSQAAEVLSTITGALVVANALGDTAEYDRATRNLLRQGAAVSELSVAARARSKWNEASCKGGRGRLMRPSGGPALRSTNPGDRDAATSVTSQTSVQWIGPRKSILPISTPLWRRIA